MSQPLSVPRVLHAQQGDGRRRPPISLGDRYGFFKIERYGAADRRHRLVTSGIVAAAGATCSSRRSPTSGRACRSAPTQLARPQRRRLHRRPAGGRHAGQRLPRPEPRRRSTRSAAARGLTAGDRRWTARASPTSTCGCRSSSASARRAAEFIAQLFNIFNRANFNTPNASITRGQRHRRAAAVRRRARRCCRTSTRRRGRRSSRSGSSSDGIGHGDGHRPIVTVSRNLIHESVPVLKASAVAMDRQSAIRRQP